jgi:hypothetical protein
MSKRMEMGRSVYKQPETKVDESCHSKEGSMYSVRHRKCAVQEKYAIFQIHENM